jgi:hypothetical protein
MENSAIVDSSGLLPGDNVEPPHALQSQQQSSTLPLSFNLGALVGGFVWYFGKGLWRKALLFIAVGVVASGFTLSQFGIVVVRLATVPFEAFSATVNVNGEAQAATPEQQARNIEIVVLSTVVLAVLARVLRGQRKRALLLLLIGITANTLVPGSALVSLWILSGLMANYDYALLKERGKAW